MKKVFQLLLVLFVVGGVTLFSPKPSQAQTPPPPPTKPEQTPIDGGLGILAAVGGAYAIKKLRDRKE